jgi:urease accessory protein
LQLFGGLFPSGAFSHSFGLETYVADGRVQGADDLKRFARMYLHGVVGACEGVFFSLAHRAAAGGRPEDVGEYNRLLAAMKLTKESREASLRLGNALLRTAKDMLAKAGRESGFPFGLAEGEAHHATVCGALMAALGVGPEDAAEGYVFAAVSGLLQCGVKLIPVGGTDAQAALLDLHAEMRAVAARICRSEARDAVNFCPALDIAQIAHESLPSRLYMT